MRRGSRTCRRLRRRRRDRGRLLGRLLMALCFVVCCVVLVVRSGRIGLDWIGKMRLGGRFGVVGGFVVWD